MLTSLAGAFIGGRGRGCPDGQDVFNENRQGRTEGGNHTYAAMCHAAHLRKKRIRCFTAENKHLVFDAAGNEQAIAALKASNKKDNLKVKVSVEVAGDMIKVASLKLQYSVRLGSPDGTFNNNVALTTSGTASGAGTACRPLCTTCRDGPIASAN
jgi:hypothetical protein